MSRSPHARRRRLVAGAITLALGLGGALLLATPAQAVPDAPVITSPLDNQGVLSATVPVDVTVGNAIGTQTVTISINGGAPTYCAGPVTGPTTVSCASTLPGFGDYTLAAISTDSGDSATTSSTGITIHYGDSSAATLTAPTTGNTVTGYSTFFNGTGPKMGTIAVNAVPNDGSPVTPSPFVVCTATVNAAGAWTCNNTGNPLPSLRLWDLQVTGADVTGTAVTPSVTVTVPFQPNHPQSITPVPSQGGLAVTVQAVPSESGDTELRFRNYYGAFFGPFDCPVTPGFGSAPAPGGGNVSCSQALPVGIILIQSATYINDTHSNDRGDLIRIPESPVITSAVGSPGAMTVSGTRADPDANDLDTPDTVNNGSIITVLYGGSQFCTDTTNTRDLTWSCTGLASTESNPYIFTAIATSTGFADDPAVGGSQNGGYIQGISVASGASSAATVPSPPSPDVSITTAFASIGVTVTAGSGGEARAQLSSAYASEGFYGSNLYNACTTRVGNNVDYGGQVVSCVFDSLPAGLWQVTADQRVVSSESDTGHDSSGNDDSYVLIPSQPSISGSGNASGVSLSGSGIPGDIVHVYNSNGGERCESTVSSRGTWSCTVASTAAVTTWRASQESQGFTTITGDPAFQGFSLLTDAIAVTLPTPPPAPIAWKLSSSFGSTTIHPGDTITLEADGLPPAATVDAEIHSTPIALGSAIVGNSGAFSLPVTIPASLEPGQHTLVVTVTPVGGVPSPISMPVTITPADKVIERESPSNEPDHSGFGSDAAIIRTEPASPSAVTHSVPTLGSIFSNAVSIVAAAGLALMVLLLVALPTELLSSTISANSRRFGRGVSTIGNAVKRATQWFVKVTRTPAIAAAVIVLVTSLVFGFVDPGFGFDIVSLRLVLSLGIGLFLVSYVASWISGAIVKRAWGVVTSIEMQPAAILLAVVGVIVARSLHFSPGFLIGLAIGLELSTRTKEPFRSRATAVQFGTLGALAVVAWLVYSGLQTVQHPDFGTQLLADAMVATISEGLTAATIGLLPLGFLDGRDLFRHSRRLWLLVFGIIATLFCLLVLPTATGQSGITDWLSWTIVFASFATLTLALWAVFAWISRNDKDDDEDTAVAEKARVDAG